MYLSDQDIKKALKQGQITIDDFDESRLQPASYDILLGNQFLFFERHNMLCIDPKEDMSSNMTSVNIPDEKAFILQPNEFVLAVTKDRFGVDAAHCCRLMGKSSIARLGLIIHTTGSFIDPGNTVNATLHLYNTNRLPIKLYPGMKIGQIAFCRLTSPAQKPYGHKSLGSKYYMSKSIQASQMHKNFADK